MNSLNIKIKILKKIWPNLTQSDSVTQPKSWVLLKPDLTREHP